MNVRLGGLCGVGEGVVIGRGESREGRRGEGRGRVEVVFRECTEGVERAADLSEEFGVEAAVVEEEVVEEPRKAPGVDGECVVTISEWRGGGECIEDGCEDSV